MQVRVFLERAVVINMTKIRTVLTQIFLQMLKLVIRSVSFSIQTAKVSNEKSIYNALDD